MRELCISSLSCWLVHGCLLSASSHCLHSMPLCVQVSSSYKDTSHIGLGPTLCTVVQLPSCVLLFETPWTLAHQASLSLTISCSLPRFMSIESVMPSNYLILCHRFLLLPSIFPSIRVFSNELALCSTWLKYWSVSFSISPPDEYSGLISFRTNSFDLPAVEGTLKSLLQHHSLRVSILWCSAFFMVQLSRSYVTTEKTIASDFGPQENKVSRCFHCSPIYYLL